MSDEILSSPPGEQIQLVINKMTNAQYRQLAQVSADQLAGELSSQLFFTYGGESDEGTSIESNHQFLDYAGYKNIVLNTNTPSQNIYVAYTDYTALSDGVIIKFDNRDDSVILDIGKRAINGYFVIARLMTGQMMPIKKNQQVTFCLSCLDLAGSTKVCNFIPYL